MATPRLPGAPGRHIPQYVRDEVLDTYGTDCVYCGSPDRPSLDHVYPWVQGGSTTAANLVPACMVCNRLAGERVFADLRDKSIWVVNAREALGYDKLSALADAIDASMESTIRSMTR